MIILRAIGIIIILLFSVAFGFALWYFIFWFFTNQPNPILWHWVVKVLYLFLGIITTDSLSSNLINQL